MRCDLVCSIPGGVKCSDQQSRLCLCHVDKDCPYSTQTQARCVSRAHNRIGHVMRRRTGATYVSPHPHSACFTQAIPSHDAPSCPPTLLAQRTCNVHGRSLHVPRTLHDCVRALRVHSSTLFTSRMFSGDKIAAAVRDQLAAGTESGKRADTPTPDETGVESSDDATSSDSPTSDTDTDESYKPPTTKQAQQPALPKGKPNARPGRLRSASPLPAAPVSIAYMPAQRRRSQGGPAADATAVQGPSQAPATSSSVPPPGSYYEYAGQRVLVPEWPEKGVRIPLQISCGMAAIIRCVLTNEAPKGEPVLSGKDGERGLTDWGKEVMLRIRAKLAALEKTDPQAWAEVSKHICHHICIGPSSVGRGEGTLKGTSHHRRIAP